MMPKFSAELHELRQRARVGLRELAREARMDPAHLSKLERGNTVPRRKTVERVLIALRQLIETSARLTKREQRALAQAADILLSADYEVGGLGEQFFTRLGAKKPSELRATFDVFRKDFETLLRGKGLADSEVEAALRHTTPETIQRVVLGEEEVHIRDVQEVPQSEIDRRRRAGEEVYHLGSPGPRVGSPAPRKKPPQRGPARKASKDSAQAYLNRTRAALLGEASLAHAPRPRSTRIRAGPRAHIAIRGKLDASQREQLGNIAQLIETLLRKEH